MRSCLLILQSQCVFCNHAMSSLLGRDLTGLEEGDWLEAFPLKATFREENEHPLLSCLKNFKSKVGSYTLGGSLSLRVECHPLEADSALLTAQKCEGSNTGFGDVDDLDARMFNKGYFSRSAGASEGH